MSSVPNHSEYRNKPQNSFINWAPPQSRQTNSLSSHAQNIRTSADGQVRESTHEGHCCIQPPSHLHLMTNVLTPTDIPVAPIHKVAPTPKTVKRRQVKNACTTCQKACKKCDDARPCLRCVRYGASEACVSSIRKTRRTGIKRGPYKKRDGTGL